MYINKQVELPEEFFYSPQDKYQTHDTTHSQLYFTQKYILYILFQTVSLA